MSKLKVTNRNISEGMEVTLYSADSAADLITVTTADGSLKSYILADDVKVLLYGETSSLAMLEKGMTIELTLFHAGIIDGTPKLLEHNDICWILPEEIPEYEFCPADQEILEKITKLYCKGERKNDLS